MFFQNYQGLGCPVADIWIILEKSRYLKPEPPNCVFGVAGPITASEVYGACFKIPGFHRPITRGWSRVVIYGFRVHGPFAGSWGSCSGALEVLCNPCPGAHEDPSLGLEALGQRWLVTIYFNYASEFCSKWSRPQNYIRIPSTLTPIPYAGI